MKIKIFLSLICFLFTSGLLFSSDAKTIPGYPYVTDEAWRKICDWEFNQAEPFNPKQVARGDTVFVEFNSLRRFRKIARKIKHPFILITGGHDRPLPGPHSKLLNIKNIAAWFVQNIDCPASDRLIPIPIGLPRIAKDFNPEQGQDRNIYVYVNFNIFTNKEARQPCWDYFSKKSWTHLAQNQSHQDYLRNLSRSVFTISPPGNGLDCFRTWEALCLKCYPVVLSTPLNPLYEGLPVVIVNKWEEVTEEFLNAKKEEFNAHEWNYEKAYLPYWINKIESIQKQIRSCSGVQK